MDVYTADLHDISIYLIDLIKSFFFAGTTDELTLQVTTTPFAT